MQTFFEFAFNVKNQEQIMLSIMTVLYYYV